MNFFTHSPLSQTIHYTVFIFLPLQPLNSCSYMEPPKMTMPVKPVPGHAYKQCLGSLPKVALAPSLVPVFLQMPSSKRVLFWPICCSLPVLIHSIFLVAITIVCLRPTQKAKWRLVFVCFVFIYVWQTSCSTE